MPEVRSSKSTMNRRHRIVAIAAAFWSVLIGVPAVVLCREVHQQGLNQRLIAAIKREDTPTALRALALGADVNSRDCPTIPLRVLIWNLLRGRGIHRPSSGETALRLCVQGSQAETARRLLWRGASTVQDVGTDKQSLIGIALDGSNDELVWLLMHHNAIDATDLPKLLLWAVRRDDVATARDMLARGASVNGDPSSFDASPLFTAMESNNRAMAHFLLKHGASINSRGERLDYAGVLSLAAERNDFAMVRFFLKHGAHVNAVERRGSALTKAAEAGHIDMVRLLLAHKADPNIGNYHNSLLLLVRDKPGIFNLLL
jgi:ankyrin repeat protein